MLIEIGGGTKPHPRADIVIDMHHPKEHDGRDATRTPWRVGVGFPTISQIGKMWEPLQDAVADEVYCSHLLEHIPKGRPLIKMMNEAWRVLKPGGTFTAILPIVGVTDPVYGRGMLVKRHEAWADPTHVAQWWMPEGMLYFGYQHALDADYGMHQWLVGDHIPEDRATELLQAGWAVDYEHRIGATDGQSDPWWSVRGGWEAAFRMVKP